MVIDAREKNKKGKGIGSIREGCGQILGSGKLSLKNNVWEKLRGTESSAHSHITPITVNRDNHIC